MLVNETEVAVNELRLNLAGQVQQGRARRPGLHHGAGRIATAGAGAGHAHPDHTADARGRIGHIAGAGLAAGRYKANLPAPVKGVEDGHVVDRDHAEGGAHATRLEEAGDRFAHSDGLGAHAAFLWEGDQGPRPGRCCSLSLSWRAASQTPATSSLSSGSSMRWAGTVTLMAAATLPGPLKTGAATVEMPDS